MVLQDYFQNVEDYISEITIKNSQGYDVVVIHYPGQPYSISRYSCDNYQIAEAVDKFLFIYEQ